MIGQPGLMTLFVLTDNHRERAIRAFSFVVRLNHIATSQLQIGVPEWPLGKIRGT